MALIDLDGDVNPGKGNLIDLDAPDPNASGDAARGFKRAFAQVPELAYGVGALSAMTAENLFGEGGISTTVKNYFAEKFTQKQAENQKYAPSVEFTDAWENLKKGDVGSMVDWLQDSAGYVVGQGIQTLATGGVGAMAGKAVLSGATEKMLGGVVAKQAAKIAEENAVRQGLTGTAKEAAIKAALPEATKLAAQRTAQVIGAGVVLNAQNLGMEAGDIYGGLMEESAKNGKPVTGDDLLRAWGAAAAAAGTETATDLLGLGAVTGRIKIGGKSVQAMPGAKGKLVRGAMAAGVAAPLEGTQEYVQTALEQYGAGKPLDTEEARHERINAAAVGALGGTLVGGGAGLISKERADADAIGRVMEAPTVDDAIAAATAATEAPQTQTPPQYPAAPDVPMPLSPDLPELTDGPRTQEQRLWMTGMEAREQKQKSIDLDRLQRESKLPAALYDAEQKNAMARASGELDVAGAPNAMQLALQRAQDEAGKPKFPPAPAVPRPNQPEWANFPSDSGTLGIPRKDMPQVKAEHRGALVNFLKARDVESQHETVPAESLKPSQAEFSPAKVRQALEYKGGDRSILISSDNHIVDGHHQWLAKARDNQPIQVIRLNAPIKDLLPLVKEFPSSGDEQSFARESWQWKRNAQGNQTFGNRQRIEPMTRALFEQHIQPRVGKAFKDYDAWRAANPDDTHINLFEREDGVTVPGKPLTGKLADLRPQGEAMQKGWAKQVTSFEDPEARKFGATADQEPDILGRPASELSDAELTEAAKFGGARLRKVIQRELAARKRGAGDAPAPQKPVLIMGKPVDKLTDQALEFAAKTGGASVREAAQAELNRRREANTGGAFTALKDENLRATLSGMRQGIGADERGGKLIIDETTRDEVPGFGDIKGKTVWTGEPWWFGRPDQGLSADAARAAIDKALAGQRLGDREQRFIDYLLEIANKNEAELAEAQREAEAQPEYDDLSDAGQGALEALIANGIKVLGDERVNILLDWVKSNSTDEAQYGELLKDALETEIAAAADRGQGEATAESRAGQGADRGQPDTRGPPERDVSGQGDSVSGEVATEQSGATTVSGSPENTDGRDAPPDGQAADRQEITPPTGGVSTFGAGNKVFTQSAADKARETLRKKLGNVNSGIDPETMQAGLQLAGYYIEGGARSFADYSKKMVADLGEAVRPYLKSWYLAVRNHPGIDRAGMDSEAQIDAMPDGGDAVAAKAVESKVDGKNAVEINRKSLVINAAIEKLGGEANFRKVVDEHFRELEKEGDPVEASNVTEEIEALAGAVLDGWMEDGPHPFPSIDFKADPKLKGKEFPVNENVFPAPDKTVVSTRIAGEFISMDEAQKRLAEWKAEAKRIGQEQDNSKKVVISMYDRTGIWSQPFVDAGYTVIRYDLAHGDDLMRFFPTADLQNIKEAGMEIVGVIAQPPCTSFAVSGARWWADQHDKPSKAWVKKKYGDFAAEYHDTPLEVGQTLGELAKVMVEFANPTQFYVLENPVGRIAEVLELPKPTMTIQPHNYGDPYTKKTMLWGEFNTDLPTANVEPVEGSKMHKLRGDDPEQKDARSATPEGFAYAFFMANHRAGAVKSKAPDVSTEQMFDSEKFDAERAARVKASRDAGNTHLDKITPAVETMRGLEIYYVHDPKVRGTVRTVANTGEVVINWKDDYSGEKEMATKRKDGKREVWQSWLMPSDLKDYVVDKKRPALELTGETPADLTAKAQRDAAVAMAEAAKSLKETADQMRDSFKLTGSKREADQAAASGQGDLLSGALEPRKGTVGGRLSSGEVVLTNTGRQTSPFPAVKMGSNRAATSTVKAVDRWLMQNALDEANSSGDEFNARQFKANLEKPQQADKDSAEEYLFGDTIPPVVPSILKPLVPESTAEAPTKTVEPKFAESGWDFETTFPRPRDDEELQQAGRQPLSELKDQDTTMEQFVADTFGEWTSELGAYVTGRENARMVLASGKDYKGKPQTEKTRKQIETEIASDTDTIQGMIGEVADWFGPEAAQGFADLVGADSADVVVRGEAQTSLIEEPSAFDAYDKVAKEYGYRVDADGTVIKDGKDSGVVRVVVKGGRLRVEAKDSGNLLFSGAGPESLGEFIRKFWMAEKKPPEKRDTSALPVQTGVLSGSLTGVQRVSGFKRDDGLYDLMSRDEGTRRLRDHTGLTAEQVTEKLGSDIADRIFAQPELRWGDYDVAGQPEADEQKAAPSRNMNAKHSVSVVEVMTPGGGLRAAAMKSKADSSPWWFQGDIMQLAFDQTAIINGQKGGTPEGQKTLDEYKAARKAGWSYRNVRGGSYGTVNVFMKDGKVLTRTGAEAIAAGAFEETKPENTGDRDKDFHLMQRAAAQDVAKWLGTMPESTLQSPAALSAKLGMTPIGKRIGMERDDVSGAPFFYGKAEGRPHGSWRYFAPSRLVNGRMEMSKEYADLLRSFIRYAKSAEDATHWTDAEREAEAYANQAADDNKSISDVLRENGFSAQTANEPVAAAESAPAVGDAPFTPDSALAFLKSLRRGEVSLADYKAAFNKYLNERESMTAQFLKMSKEQLIKEWGGRRDMTKERLAKSAYEDLIGYFNLKGSVSYVLGDAGGYIGAVRKNVEGLTEETYQEAIAERKKASEQRQSENAAVLASIENPQTMADFRLFLRYKKQSEMTDEQMARYDNLVSEEGRAARDQRMAERAKVTAASENVGANIIQTKHTKKGHDLFVVQLEKRVEREDYNRLNTAAKRLGGYYSSFRGGGAVQGFQFTTMENAKAFQQLAGGDTTAATEAAQARQAERAEEKEGTAVERLRAMAERLETRAEEVMSADRKTNTARRARMANAAESAARHDQYIAKTMRRLADGIESGEFKHIDLIRTKEQVLMLDTMLRTARNDKARADGKDSVDWDKQPMDESILRYVEYPVYESWRSDIAAFGRSLAEVDGAKMLGERILKAADDTRSYVKELSKDPTMLMSVVLGTTNGNQAFFKYQKDAVAAWKRSTARSKSMPVEMPDSLKMLGKWAVVLSPQVAKERGLWKGDDDAKMTLTPDAAEEALAKAKVANGGSRWNQAVRYPHWFDTVQERRKRLSAMGVDSTPVLRAALREFLKARGDEPKANRVKELERALAGRGRNVGVDFFPTPAGVAAEMVERAGIEEGMSVLEPSAGNGNIADAIREAGVDPDVVEMSSALREILEAKGFNVIATDFTQFDPRGFTYGDKFKHVDGRIGVMRGSGGMGSGRVGFIPEGKDERTREWVDRDDLTGVEKVGFNSGYDRIVMNPPFSNGMDIDHVRHAFEHLRPGGRLVAIMGEGAFTRNDSKAKEFREWLESMDGTDEKLPANTFMDASLMATTGANARMVVIDKPETGDTRFSRNPMPDRLIMRRRKDGLPVFGNKDIAMVRPKHFRNDEGLLVYDLFDTRYVEAGVSEAKSKVGLVELEVQPDGTIAGLSSLFIRNDLQAPKRIRQALNDMGYGEKVIRAILATLPDGQRLRIYDIIPSARGFWEKMGTTFEQGRIIENGFITRQSYERSRGALPSGDPGLVFSRRDGTENPADERATAGGRGRPETAETVDPLAFLRNPADAGFSVSGLTMRDAQAVYDRIAPTFTNLPPVTLLNRPGELPDRVKELRDEIHRAGAWSDVEGAFHDGEIFIFTDNIADEARLEHVLFEHEVRHYGLRGAFGKELDGILNGLMMRNPALRERALALRERLGLDSNVTAAEEVLADIPVDELVQLSGIDRFIAFIRDWLAKHNFTRLAARMDAMLVDRVGEQVAADALVADVIMAARDFARNGKPEKADLYMRGTRFADTEDGRTPPIWYSAFERFVDAKAPNSATAEQWGNTLDAWAKQGKFKADELEWSGVKEWLVLHEPRNQVPFGAPPGFVPEPMKITKQEVLGFIRNKGVKVEETMLGGESEDLARQERDDLNVRLTALGFQQQSDDDGAIQSVTGRDGTVYYIDNPLEGEKSLDDLPEEVQEVVIRLGELQLDMSDPDFANDNETRYRQYTMPGGKNYRELLLTLPSKFKGPNFDGWSAKYVGGGAWQVIDNEGEGRGNVRAERDADQTEIINRWYESPAGSGFRVSSKLAAGDFKSSHWDQPNILAHIRFNERTDAEGKRVLFIEEIQSDWAQRGKREGFNKPTRHYVIENEDGGIVYENPFVDRTDARRRMEAMQKEYPNLRLRIGSREIGSGWNTIPSAPFVQKTEAWVSLALKRMIRYAAENGFDRVAFVTGQQSADRYDLSKQVGMILWRRLPEGDYALRLNGPRGGDIRGMEGTIRKTAQELPDFIGKALAEKITGAKESSGQLTGLDLKVGGEGMRTFYDKIVPNVANDLLKKLGGGRVQSVKVATGPGEMREAAYDFNGDGDWVEVAPKKYVGAVTNQPGFDITPEMRATVMRGLPMFSRTNQTNTPAFRQWFGDSKVVDVDGRPLRVYHGTSRDFSEFSKNAKPAHIPLPGFFFAPDPKMAERFTEKFGREIYDDEGYIATYEGANLMPVFLSMQNPMDVDVSAGAKKGFYSANDIRDVIEDAKRRGHDGMILRGWKDGSGPIQYAVFRPEQIKSAVGNRGTFDQKNPDIRFSRATAKPSERDRITDKAFNFVNDLIQSDRRFNLWHRTVGTQQHKALINPEFKRVYDESQRFLSDISLYANSAANMAQDLMPRIEGFKDFFKKSPSQADINAAGNALMQGTLFGGGSPLNGRIWTDEELKTGRLNGKDLPLFEPLTEAQIKLYRQALTAVNHSLDEFAKSMVYRYAKPYGIFFDRGMGLADVVAEVNGVLDDEISNRRLEIESLEDQLTEAKREADAEYDREDADARNAHFAAVRRRTDLQRKIDRIEKEIAGFQETRNLIADVEQKTLDLQKHGYFPAMRFGQYAVYVVNKDPVTGETEQVHFSLHDTQREANAEARLQAERHPKAEVTKGVVSQERHRLFQGLSLDALETFAEHMNIDADPIVQGFLRAATSQRSTLKRQIHRKGLAGFTDDIPRALASFVVSTARTTSSNYHTANMLSAAQDIKAGDVQDEAVKLVRYLLDPVEEAAALRGFLFFNFIGGSIAHGIVNMTQPLMVTAPWLSQHTSYADAVSQLAKAMKEISSGAPLPRGVAEAVAQAKDEGIVAPQEIHQLRAEAGPSIAGKNLLMRKLTHVWGSIYSVTEQFNRESTFIAAYRIGVAKKVANPYQFAVDAVNETQFVYNKASRPNWARGPVGATVMTFKQFSISYLELMKRMHKKDKKAFAIMVLTLIAAAGLEGLPFAEDLEDLIDTVGQWMGFATNSKKALRNFATDILGKEVANFALHGVSAGLPVDVSVRLGLQNLVPGTAMLNPSAKNKAGDVVEILGPAGQFVPVEGTTLGRAIERLTKGDVFGAAKAGSPVAIKNFLTGTEMLETGEARDTTGKKIVDVTEGDAVAKMIGLQPARVAESSRRIEEVGADIAIQRAKEMEIADKWARGTHEKDLAVVREAMQELRDWNENNPELRIRITPTQINQRVKQMKLERDARFVKQAPPEIRREVRERLQQP